MLGLLGKMQSRAISNYVRDSGLSTCDHIQALGTSKYAFINTSYSSFASPYAYHSNLFLDRGVNEYTEYVRYLRSLIYI